MKNIIKSLFVTAAAALAFTACEYDPIPEQDNYSGYKGVTGDFVYMVGGSDVLFNAAECDIFHTPIGELGEIVKEGKVALTKKQSTAVTVSLAGDSSLIKGGYEEFPAGVLDYPATVTIPAGETEASFTISVDNAKFSQLTEAKYMLALVVSDVKGGDVKLSSNSRASYLYVNTETINPADNMVNLKADTKTFQLIYYNDVARPADVSANLSVTGSKSAFMPFDVVFKVDNSLVAAYNEANGTAYNALPSDVEVLFENTTMAKDATSLTAKVSIPEASNGDRETVKLLDDPGYVVPIVIESVGDATVASTSQVVYLVVKVTVNDYDSAYFMSLDLTDGVKGGMYANYMWDEPVFSVTDGKFMFSLDVYADHFKNSGATISRLCQWCDKEEGHSIMLRWGEGGKGNRLQVCGSMSGNFFVDYEFPEKEWFTITVVGDGTNLKILVNGTEVGSHALARTDMVFQRFELGMSWGGYYSSQAWNGRIHGMTAWTGDMTSSYFWNGYKIWLRDDVPGVVRNASLFKCQLQGWWKLEEGKGHIFHDDSGRGLDMDWSNVWATPNESDYINVDYSASIEEAWRSDSNNLLPESW